MTLESLYKEYEKVYNSRIFSERQISKGLLDIIDLYKKSKKDEIFEEVKISLIAEDYYKEMSSLWNNLKLNKYKYNSLAAKMCIIKYASTNEIIKELKYINNKSFNEYIEIIKKSSLSGRVKKADLLSVYNLEKL